MKWRSHKWVDEYSLSAVVLKLSGQGNFINQTIMLLLQDYIEQVVIPRRIILEQLEEKISLMKHIKTSKMIKKEFSEALSIKKNKKKPALGKQTQI